MIRGLAIAMIVITGVSAAHHSAAMFVETPVWVTGTVVKYRPGDPHAMIELQEPQASGPARKWIVEGPRRGRLERILQNNGDIRDDQINLGRSRDRCQSLDAVACKQERDGTFADLTAKLLDQERL